jgi:hypothetical protein
MEDVLYTLKRPFVPLKPTFGPTFHRPLWEEQLRSKNFFVYDVYPGVRGSGKSVALTNALEGREGVVHCKLRDSTDIIDTFARSIGIMHADKSMFFALEEACSEFKGSRSQKPIIIVEDIDKGRDSKSNRLTDKASYLARNLVNMYDCGLLHVIYTVSNWGYSIGDQCPYCSRRSTDRLLQYGH